MGLIKAFIIVVALCTPFASAIPSHVKPLPRGWERYYPPKPPPVFSNAGSYDGYELPFRGMGHNRISSGFGMRRHPIFGDFHAHQGVDFPKPYGTAVYPARDGVVVFAGWRGKYGRVVEIRHGDGGSTIYGHLARFFVSAGETVRKDKLLGLVGSSGLSTGPHLHFEYRTASGRAFDPRYILSLR